jgi:hypothetical protein
MSVYRCPKKANRSFISPLIATSEVKTSSIRYTDLEKDFQEHETDNYNGTNNSKTDSYDEFGRIILNVEQMSPLKNHVAVSDVTGNPQRFPELHFLLSKSREGDEDFEISSLVTKLKKNKPHRGRQFRRKFRK